MDASEDALQQFILLAKGTTGNALVALIKQVSEPETRSPRVALTTSNANVGEVAAMETLMLLAKLGR